MDECSRHIIIGQFRRRQFLSSNLKIGAHNFGNSRRGAAQRDAINLLCCGAKDVGGVASRRRRRRTIASSLQKWQLNLRAQQFASSGRRRRRRQQGSQPSRRIRLFPPPPPPLGQIKLPMQASGLICFSQRARLLVQFDGFKSSTTSNHLHLRSSESSMSASVSAWPSGLAGRQRAAGKRHTHTERKGRQPLDAER